MTTRRGLFGLLAAVVATPAALVAPRRAIGRTIRVRLPENFKVIDRTTLLTNPGKITYFNSAKDEKKFFPLYEVKP